MKFPRHFEKFGLRVQKSVFQCDVPPLKAQEIKDTLLSIIMEKEDSLFLYPVCDDCVKKAYLMGDKTLLQNARVEIL